MSSVDKTLTRLVSRGYALEPEAEKVHEGLKRLQEMIDVEIDEAEALQAAGEWTFVSDSCGAGVSPASKEQAGRLHQDVAPERQAGRLHHNADDAARALDPESEDDHGDR